MSTLKEKIPDFQTFTKLAIEYNVGVQTEETIKIKKIDIDFFNEFE